MGRTRRLRWTAPLTARTTCAGPGGMNLSRSQSIRLCTGEMHTVAGGEEADELALPVGRGRGRRREHAGRVAQDGGQRQRRLGACGTNRQPQSRSAATWDARLERHRVVVAVDRVDDARPSRGDCGALTSCVVDDIMLTTVAGGEIVASVMMWCGALYGSIVSRLRTRWRLVRVRRHHSPPAKAADVRTMPSRSPSANARPLNAGAHGAASSRLSKRTPLNEWTSAGGEP